MSELLWPGDRRTIAGFDGLRAFAVLHVIAFHAWRIAPDNASGALRGILGAGWSGVDVFFSLSGFLITGILLHSRGREGYWKNFYLRRAIRILPLYWVFLLLNHLWGFVGDAFQGCSPAYSYWTFLANFWEPYCKTRDPRLFPMWSLAVEEQFYAVWPLVVALCSRRVLWGVVVAIILGSPVIRHVVHSPEHAGTYMLPYCRADALAWGAAAALAWEHRSELAVKVARWTAVPAVAGSLLGMATNHFYRWSPAFVTVGYTLVAFTVAATVLALASGGLLGLRKVLELRAIAWIGKVSYGLYVLHATAIVLTEWGWDRMGLGIKGEPLMHAAFAATALAIALGMAAISWFVLEAPMLRLKDKVARYVD